MGYSGATNKQNFSLLFKGVFIILFLVAISTTALAYWVLSETHNAEYARDHNWFGRHACPSTRQKTLREKLPSAPNRPDEDLLWKERLFEFVRRQKSYQSLAMFIDKQEFEKQQKKYLDELLTNESHYRVEVRRTIQEIEASHPVYVCPDCETEDSYNVLTTSGVTYQIGCATGYPKLQTAHDRGRSDALVWYLKHNIHPVNFKKVN